jgi:signal transduction histidine kinase
MVFMLYEIIDKILLLIGCMSLYLFSADNSYAIIPVIISVLLSCLFMYFEDDRLKLAGNLCFAILCIFIPEYVIFLPLLLYNELHTRYQYTVLAVPFIFIFNLVQYSAIIISFTVIFLFVSYLLKLKTDKLKALQNEYNELRDNSVKISLQLEDKNRRLLENQDSEINLATLNERNRISKEIHDNIGHLLSRALLQVGALITISKDEDVKEGLVSLKDSLSQGMDQIRSSIHQMYDESIDLYSQIDHLVKDFTFCSIHYDYDISNSPPVALKHSMIAIVKEALVNIIRHSNATKVSVQLREHPAMYQLIISDNGTIDGNKRKLLINAFEKQEYGEGMGLHNIYDRIKGFNGNINISLDNGFQLFISVPKKTAQKSN